MYEDIYDAKAAVDHLSGFNVCGRYLIVLYYQARSMTGVKGIEMGVLKYTLLCTVQFGISLSADGLNTHTHSINVLGGLSVVTNLLRRPC